MSHFTTIKVEIKNGEILQKTLQELGFKVKCQAPVRGYMGSKVEADYVIEQEHGYDLGFRRQGETYELIADFWGAMIDPQDFVRLVTQKYAYNSLLATVKNQGFTLEQQETLADGTVRVVVGRWL
ncbi:Protein of unknown function (DUF1257) [Synechococcus sp. PCC 7502]|uniref:DUF1257 domain-containing protein n=1 Tax=Synechococcus sp. PCC 7502 TaxID=1173263 RepID=UPI00029FF71D|nr:DUF1257 domain-containing protein [Synechococcus sp. PCC 7502]AFY74401.1 Protein of unknown function (DUF1257) [Synechococcus sp. PCC 7502]